MPRVKPARGPRAAGGGRSKKPRFKPACGPRAASGGRLKNPRFKPARGPRAASRGRSQKLRFEPLEESTVQTRPRPARGERRPLEESTVQARPRRRQREASGGGASASPSAGGFPRSQHLVLAQRSAPLASLPEKDSAGSSPLECESARAPLGQVLSKAALVEASEAGSQS